MDLLNEYKGMIHESLPENGDKDTRASKRPPPQGWPPTMEEQRAEYRQQKAKPVTMTVSFIYVGGTYQWEFRGSDGSYVIAQQQNHRIPTYEVEIKVDNIVYYRTIRVKLHEILEYPSKALFLKKKVEGLYNDEILPEHRGGIPSAANNNESEGIPDILERFVTFITLPYKEHRERKRQEEEAKRQEWLRRGREGRRRFEQNMRQRNDTQ